MKNYIFILAFFSFYLKAKKFNPSTDVHPTFKSYVDHRINKKIKEKKKYMTKQLLK